MVAHRLTAISFLPDFVLHCTFEDGTKKMYDMKQLFDDYPVFRAFVQTPELFLQGYVSPRGYGVIWNDVLDISAMELYLHGVNA